MEASLKLLEATSDKTIDKKIYILATVDSRASILLADLLSPLSVGHVWVKYDAMKIALMNHFKSLFTFEDCGTTFYTTTQYLRETSF